MTITFKTYRELVSIKRAQWTFVWLTLISVSTVVALACYGAATMNSQIKTISQSVAGETISRTKLQARIAQAFQRGGDGDFYTSLLVNRLNVMMRVNTFSHAPHLNGSFITCPASHEYKMYLREVSQLHRKPVISNVFLFAGTHGLGKSYASYQLGKTLSRFDRVTVISVPMMTFGNINEVGAIIEGIETALGGTENCGYIIWTFDELDSYVMHKQRDMRDKSITEFAEYTGFIRGGDAKVKNEGTSSSKGTATAAINNEGSGGNRVLVFTMNNAEMLMHDYWADRDVIEHNLTGYRYADDYRKALEFTGLSQLHFLQEGQLSRLRSFVGNKLFLFKKFNFKRAKEFATEYLTGKGIVYNSIIELKLFGNNTVSVEDDNKNVFSVRELKIAMDDIVNIYLNKLKN
ncbi:Hypothetical protein Trvi_ORF119 [Trabala vishnou gigantina nucleopolyhedrovirus]|uniref:Hypothetical protein n=1 Tax=Trabala vishnou gigantina nucleopolyhedrovirus TaxID=2863583 RepID=UPI002481E849|nr:Hypothetical protein QKU87_gp119 [Trabala vishnou gigantina nucleopolyhedrovirus]QYC92681.1 Hypothetical protein Trvi_ORF119 [Trabala vishnou gigantina nucleopolyhedrovirus]